MTEYTVDLRLSSSVITPFQSDTLFGHICWAIRYLWVTAFLKNLFWVSTQPKTLRLMIYR